MVPKTDNFNTQQSSNKKVNKSHVILNSFQDLISKLQRDHARHADCGSWNSRRCTRTKFKPKDDTNRGNFFSLFTLHTSLGFTLSEVLIVVGIIGIIAEMTIPTLVQNVDDTATVVALKKEMSVLQQAMTAAQADDNQMDNWPGTDQPSLNASANAALSKYLKVQKNCGTASGCFAPIYISSVKSSTYTLNLDSNGYSKMLLADGTSIAINCGYYSSSDGNGNLVEFHPASIMLYVDINGPKGPNRLDFDLFEFVLYSEYYYSFTGNNPEYSPNIVYPMGYYIYSTALPNTNLNYNCSTMRSTLVTIRAYNCTAWVINYGNLDYKYTDDLTWGGKTHQ